MVRGICPKCGELGSQVIGIYRKNTRYMTYNHGRKWYKNRKTGRLYTAPAKRCFLGKTYTTDQAMEMMGFGDNGEVQTKPKITKPIQYKDGDIKCRKCGEPLIIGSNVSKHYIRVYNYICSTCRRERDRINKSFVTITK